MQKVDRTGQKFKSWTVLSRDESASAFWFCRCICGTEQRILGARLKNGTVSTSCGCVAVRHGPIPKPKPVREKGTSGRPALHGQSYTKAYKLWASYRARNLLAPEWAEFEVFSKVMEKIPDPQCGLVRINKGLPFGPDNCYWKIPGLKVQPNFPSVWA